MFSKNASRGASLLSVVLSISAIVAAGSAAYYFLHFLPQQQVAISYTPPVHVALVDTVNVQGRQPVPQPAPKPTPKPAPTVNQQTARIGESFYVDGFEIRVTSAKDLGSAVTIGKQLKPYTTKGKFLSANFSYKNVGANERSLDNIGVVFRDSMGRNYKGGNSQLDMWANAGSDFCKAINCKGPLPFFASVKPGFDGEFTVTAEVAADSKGLTAVVSNGGGLFAELSGTKVTSVGTVPLGF